jgi:ABC-type Fe3+-hydroxamate transport system substrate-binding protein
VRRAGLALGCLALAACHRPPPPHTGAARRILSLTPSWTVVVNAVGAGDRLVGVDELSDWPPPARRVPRVGSGLSPSLERILALRPDLVLVATGLNAPELAGELGRLGVRVLISRTVTFEDVYGDIDQLGAAVGRREAAAAVVARLRARISAVERRVAGLPRPKTAVVVWTDPLTVIGSGTFVAEALRAAGGDNVAGDSPQPYPQYSVERLLARAPAVIVVGKQSNGPALAPLLKLKTLPAVRDGRIHELDANLLFRPGPRLVDGIEALARVLHP